MLLPREKKIVELLYSGNKAFTTSELANILQISSRTVKADIKKIKLELKGTGCQIQTKTGKGLWLNYNQDGKRYLDGLLLNHENASSILPETRKYYIALKLLDTADYVSMESISDTLYVSKGTIMNDVNKLTSFFEALDLTLEKAVKYGIRIVGLERQRRIAKANVLRKIVVYQGNEVIDKLQPFFENIDIRFISQLIQDAEDKYKFILSDTSYINLLTHISISVERIKKGYLCNDGKYDLFQYDDSKEWHITNFFRKKLSQHYEIVLMKGDVNYIYMNIVASKYQDKSVFENSNPEEIRKISPQTFDGIIEIIREVDALYGEDLSDDESFICSLFIHINAMFTRLMNSIYLENPLKKTIKRDLTYEYEIGTYISNLLKREYYFDLTDDDICDLTLYVGASLRRKKSRILPHHPTAVIICGTGMSTSQFVEAKLKLVFPQLIIKDTIPLSRIDDLIREDQDLIISTIPVDVDYLDIITVTPMLNQDDLRLISNKINPSRHPIDYGKGKYGALTSLFHENITILKCDCRSRDEVIQLLGTRLIHEKYVDDGYIESVMKRENLSPTSIGDGFAIPHSFKGHVLKQGIALMTLKKPVQWGNEKVQIILMLSLDPDNKDSFRVIFSQLAEMMKDYNLIEKIIDSSRYKDIMQALK